MDMELKTLTVNGVTYEVKHPESGKTYEEGYEEGYTEGKQSEYDRFWDAYQQNGNRTDYSNSFAGCGWTQENFKPKYDIAPENAYMIFRMNPCEIDLVERLSSLGVSLDLSKAINTQYMFTNSSFTRIGVIDVSSSINTSPLDSVVANCTKLVTIDKIIPKVSEYGNEFSKNSFNQCIALENLTIGGEITKNNFNVQWSTLLSHDSIVSIINALSTTTSGLTVTVSLTAVNNAFETSQGAADGSTSEEWLSLIAARENWTITLA